MCASSLIALEVSFRPLVNSAERLVWVAVGSDVCVSQDQFDLWEKVARKVRQKCLLYSCHSTSVWIEERNSALLAA
jgi:cytosine/adenosine deaminase-related metal-dependent hydrolase